MGLLSRPRTHAHTVSVTGQAEEEHWTHGPLFAGPSVPLRLNVNGSIRTSSAHSSSNSSHTLLNNSCFQGTISTQHTAHSDRGDGDEEIDEEHFQGNEQQMHSQLIVYHFHLQYSAKRYSKAQPF